MAAGLGSKEFDSLEEADIRRIARGAGGQRQGRKGEVKGSSEIRTKQDLQYAITGKRQVTNISESFTEFNKEFTQKRLSSELRRIKGKEATSFKNQLGIALSRQGGQIKNVALGAAIAVAPPTLSRAGAAAFLGAQGGGGAIGGLIAGLAAAGAQIVAKEIGRGIGIADAQNEARARSRGFASNADLIKERGAFSITGLSVAKAELGAAFAGIGRAFELGGIRDAALDQVTGFIAAVASIFGATFESVDQRLKEAISPLFFADPVRLVRERDLATWQNLPANKHPAAIKAIEDMQKNLESQLTNGAQISSYLERKKPAPGGP